jgi:hypothetical protein
MTMSSELGLLNAANGREPGAHIFEAKYIGSAVQGKDESAALMPHELGSVGTDKGLQPLVSRSRTRFTDVPGILRINYCFYNEL